MKETISRNRARKTVCVLANRVRTLKRKAYLTGYDWALLDLADINAKVDAKDFASSLRLILSKEVL